MPATGLPVRADKLRDSRLEAGLGLPALARKSGVSYPWLCKIERRGQKASITIIAKLASALDLNPADLLQDTPAATS